MVRSIVFLLLICAVGLITAPFLLSSLYIDSLGVPLTGHVSSKRENVRVHYSTWERSSEVTVQYPFADTGGVSFLQVSLDSSTYDDLHIGQPVNLHYLRREDIPAVPMARELRRAQLLPRVRFANQRAFSGFAKLFTPQVIFWCEAAGGLIVLLIIWRANRSPLFGWAIGICVLGGLAASFIYDFPKPTPPPKRDVRRASGRVKSIGEIDTLFQDDHSGGVDAGQSIDVVGVEFVPEGRTESVLAVDLIDSGSLPGLKENATVSVQYEAHAPRTAYIEGASRTFVASNIQGIIKDGLLCLVVLVVGFLGMKMIGRGYDRLINRRTG